MSVTPKNIIFRLDNDQLLQKIFQEIEKESRTKPRGYKTQKIKDLIKIGYMVIELTGETDPHLIVLKLVQGDLVKKEKEEKQIKQEEMKTIDSNKYKNMFSNFGNYGS